MSDPSVWRNYDKKRDDVPYVPRCSYCGGFREPLHMHWFFTGMYCRACIQYVLYGDERTIEDMK